MDDMSLLSKINKNKSQITDLANKWNNIKRYGYRINKNDSNPQTRVDYLYDAVGMTPAKMDYVSGTFDYGDWANLDFMTDNYPAMVKFDGTEDYRLDPDNYAFKIDGVTASDVANVDYTGNAMAKMPLMYVHRYQTTEWEYVIFCKEQYDSNYKAYAHQREDGSVMNYFWFPMFRGALDANNKLRSLSGLQPMHSKTAQQERDYAKNNGALWDAPSMSKWQFRNDLLRLIGKSTNEQIAFGRGNDSGYNASLTPTMGVLQTGQINDKGQFFGYDDGTHACKVFHSEVSWADQFLRILGWLALYGKHWVKPTPPYNFTGVGYIDTGVVCPGNRVTDYIKSSKCTDWGRVPELGGATTATYECDYVYSDDALAVGVSRVGGNCNNGLYSGASYVNLNNSATNANWNIGSAHFSLT